MGRKSYMEPFGHEVVGGGGKMVSLPLAIAGAVAAAAVAALVVGLAVGLTKKCEDCDTTSIPGTTEPTTPSGPVYPWNDVLLPRTLKPVRYDLRLRTVFSNTMDPKDFYFNGTVTMHLDVVSSADLVVFHIKDLTLDSDTIEVTQNGERIGITSKSHNTLREFYILTLERSLTAGQPAQVKISFRGPLKNDLIGIYYSSYMAEGNQTRYLLGSQMQPTDARKVFPCLDEPALKATFRTVMEHRPEMKTISNGEIYEQNTLADGWVADHYTDTVKMSTYLLAFVVSDFICLNTTTTSGKLVQVCARPNAIHQAEYASSIAADVQDFLEGFYNIPYPLNKTVHVALPDFAAGAMENWGAILYRETALLYDNTSSTAVNKQRVAVVIAHELAHMWFGNLVTPEWWDDLWLNEGFASYMEYWGVNSVENDWRMHDQFLSDDLHSVFQTDSLMTSHPIYQTVSNPDQINELFDSISYSKGASVIRMMYNFLGEDVFKAGITEYLKTNSFDVAFHTELFESLTQAYRAVHPSSSLNVTDVMLTWILQMGYPVVHMAYKNDTGVISLSQDYFLTFKDPNVTLISPYNYTWIVPISVATLNETNFYTIDQTDESKRWLRNKIGEITVNSGLPWIVGNPHEFYYYRVNYNPETWAALIYQLQANHSLIPDSSRAQLIDDAFSLARPGLVDQLVAMDLSVYLSNERDYVPWTAASRSFGYIRRMLAETPHLDLLRRYMQGQLRDVYTTTGWDENPNDMHLSRLLRGQILSLSCLYNLQDCLTNSTAKFSQLRNESTQNLVDIHARSVAYCYGIAAGDIAEWELVLDRYKGSNLATERAMFLSALACTEKSYLLDRYLALALEEIEIRRQDFATVVVGVSRNRQGQQLAWDFVRVNWKTIHNRFSLFSLSNIVAGVTESFSTQRRLNELESFIEENSGQLGAAERTITQAAEAAKANIEWRRVNELKIASWLQQHLALPSP